MRTNMKEVKALKIAQKPNASWAFEVEKLNAWEIGRAHV